MENIFFFILDTQIIMLHTILWFILARKDPLLGMAASCTYVVANPHPCWLLAQSQLSHLKSPPQPNTRPFFPLFLPTQALLYMQTILACPNFLLSTTIHTDDINMLEFSSVGHISIMNNFASLKLHTKQMPPLSITNILHNKNYT